MDGMTHDCLEKLHEENKLNLRGPFIRVSQEIDFRTSGRELSTFRPRPEQVLEDISFAKGAQLDDPACKFLLGIASSDIRDSDELSMLLDGKVL